MSKSELRRIKLMKLLMDENNYQPTKYFSEKLGVSARTIHEDVDLLNDILKDVDIVIKKVPRKGLMIEGITISNQNEVFGLVETELDIFNSVEQKQNELFSLLINKGSEYSLLELENVLGVSDSTIKKYCDILQKYLRKYAVQISYKKDYIVVSGNEDKIQNAYRNYLISLYKEYAIQFNRETFENFLQSYFNYQIIDITNLVFKMFSNRFSTYYMDQYYYSLYIHIATLITRCNVNKHISSEYSDKCVWNVNYYMFANELIEYISKKGNIQFNTSDIVFLTESLYALNVNIDITNAQKYDEKYEKVVTNVINEISTFLNVRLIDDIELYESLLNHIELMIYRLKNSIYIKNPLFEEIKNKYLLLYSLMCYAANHISRVYSVNLTGDEVSFLVIYFQISLEKNFGLTFRNVFLVLPRGLITAELIYVKIRKVIPKTDSVVRIFFDEFDSSKVTAKDIVITTEETLYFPKQIKISKMLTDEDIDNILRNYYTDYRNDNSILLNDDNNWVNPELIFLRKDFNSKAECLDFFISQYRMNNLIKDKFGESIYNREKLGDTSFSVGVSIPHADPEQVRKTSISIMTLNKKIKWGINDVNIIILFAISDNDQRKSKKYITDLLEFIEIESNRIKLLKCNKSSEVMQLLVSGKQ